MIETKNPATEKVLERYKLLTPVEIESLIARGNHTFSCWSKTTLTSRQLLFANLADLLEKNRERMSNLITAEMGKPISEAMAEVQKSASALRYYSDATLDWLDIELMNKSFPKVEVVPRPLGLILGIMPWNFPLWQVIRFVAPTMLVGNTVLVKHAPNTFGTATFLAELFAEANFPEGSYSHLPCDVSAIEGIIGDHRVKGVSLTGSTRAGRAVGRAAGASLKPYVLELGGADPYVVLDDASIELAAKAIVQARLQNAGQSCVAAKRMIVTQKNFEAMIHSVIEHFKLFVPMDPLLNECRLGPLARSDLRDTLSKQVDQLLQDGAKVLFEGSEHIGPGYYFSPMILHVPKAQSSSTKEELFGPVLTVTEAKDEDEAMVIANSTTFGLGGAIFSQDLERARVLAIENMNSGMIAINGMMRSDPRWPFGGVNDSGLGRELTRFGAHEFVNMKVLITDGV